MGSLQEALAGCLWLHVDDTMEPWPFDKAIVQPTQTRGRFLPLAVFIVRRAKKATVKMERRFVIWVRNTPFPEHPSPEWESG